MDSTLAPRLVDALRRLRQARLHVQLARERSCALAEALHVAIELLSERDRELAAVRRVNDYLRSQVRQAVRTDAERRQRDEARAA